MFAGVLFEQIAHDILLRALLAAHELAIVFDSEPQQNGGGLDTAAGLSLAAWPRLIRLFVRADLNPAVAQIAVQCTL